MRRTQTILHRTLLAAPYLGWASLGLSLVILAAYILSVEPIYRPTMDGAATNPLTVVASALLAAAILTTPYHGRRLISELLAAAAIALCLFGIFADPYSNPSYAPYMPFYGQVVDHTGGKSNAMGFNTALCISLLALAQLAKGREKVTSQTLSYVALLIPMIGIGGYLFDVPSFYGEMALSTILMLVPLSLHMMSLTATHGPLKGLLSSQDAANRARLRNLAYLAIPAIGGYVASQLPTISDDALQWLAVFLMTLTWMLCGMAAGEARQYDDLLLRHMVLKDEERKVAQSRNLLQAVIDAVPASIAVMDREGHINYANEGVASARGLAKDELIGRSWPELFGATNKQYLATTDEMRAKVLQTGEPSGLYTVQVRDAEENKRVWLAAQSKVLENPDQVILVEIEATREKLLESQLAHVYRLDAVGKMTGGLAHDFNNLLTVVIGNLESILIEANDKAEVNELSKVALSAAERGAEITRRLLLFSRQQLLEYEIIDPASLLRELEPLLRNAIPERISIDIEVAADTWPCRCDRTQLENAIFNLALNSNDAISGQGRITLTAENRRVEEADRIADADLKSGDYVVVSVADTGEGMSQETIDRAFEPFYTTKEVGNGSGLGLSMVFGLVKQSGGEVRISSKEGEGTRIDLFLPREHTLQEEQQDRQKSDEAKGGDETILVVEDDELVRNHLVGRLKSLGYSVLSSSNASEAIELLKTTEKIDLLFTDVIMPGNFSGVDLAHRVKSLLPDLKILLTSGYSEDTVNENGGVTSGFFLLAKPYRKGTLATAVRRALDSA